MNKIPTLQEWNERLNGLKITKHISGRHLVLLAEREDFEDDNTYIFLDEFILGRIEQEKKIAQQEILDRAEKLIRDNAKDVLLLDGYMATVITIPHCRELLSTLKDTNI